jgi:hypothetical protein
MGSPPSAGPFISFLTDFGPDGPAATCRGVMLSIAPQARILDIAHSVRKYAIRDGAFQLWSVLPYVPVGVHLAVVDPGVGTARLPVAIRAGRGDILVGPDNGLLVPAARRLGGIEAARALENDALMLPNRSSTFHGRDMFAPVAAHLAAGRSFDDVGPPVDPAALVDLRFPEPRVAEGRLETAIVFIDTFGNVVLAGEPPDLTAAVGPLQPGARLDLAFGADRNGSVRQSATWQQTFGAVPEGSPLLYENSSGQLAFADNRGNAATRLGLQVDRPVTITSA